MNKGSPAGLDPQLAELLQTLNNPSAPALYELSPTEARSTYKAGGGE